MIHNIYRKGGVEILQFKDNKDLRNSHAEGVFFKHLYDLAVIHWSSAFYNLHELRLLLFII